MALAALIEILKQSPKTSVENQARSLRITRVAAIEALPSFGPMAVAAIPQLQTWRNDSDPQLKRAASSALEVIEGTRPRNGKGDGDASRGLTPP